MQDGSGQIVIYLLLPPEIFGVMRCFEMVAAESYIGREGEPFVKDERVMYEIPDEACDLLEPIMEPYQQSPYWFFDKLNYGRPPAQWVFACFDREYPIAGQIAAARGQDPGVGISPYASPPKPFPSDFVPLVGVLAFAAPSSLSNLAKRSPILSFIWSELQHREREKRWLVLVDPLPSEWILDADQALWVQTRSVT